METILIYLGILFIVILIVLAFNIFLGILEARKEDNEPRHGDR